MDKNKKIILHGNHARIDQKKDVIPYYLTNGVTDNKTDEAGQVFNVQDIDATICRDEVNQNHK